MAEDGRIPRHYPLREIGGGYRERTEGNVRDSDATLIITWGEMVGGTRITSEWCDRLGKAQLRIEASRTTAEEGARKAASFVHQHGVQVLNVAGPRASEAPAAREFAYRLITALIAELRSQAARQSSV